MPIYLLLLHLAGAVMLLLWAVRMVRTGVERSHAPAMRRLMRESAGGWLRAAGIGTALAVLLQSSTAVAMLAAGFAGAGTLGLGIGLPLLLGADLGSALVVQILSVDLGWLVPVLLIGGGAMFFNGASRHWRQGGRILIGIALMLVSLSMIATATEPLQHVESLPGVIRYLGGDVVTAFVLGALFTWIVHSSVASILLIATFAAQGLVPLDLGVTLICGANFGGGLIAVGLTQASPLDARRLTMGNLLFRGAGAILLVALFQLFRPDGAWFGADVARQIVNLHLLFNLALLVICLPLTGPMARLTAMVVRPRALEQESAEGQPEGASCLDRSVIGVPALALASATRELLRMAALVERMLQPLMDLYETGDPERIRQVRRLEPAVDAVQSDIKLYLAQVRYGGDADVRRGQDLTRLAINFEYAGDIIAKTLLKLAETRRERQLSFSVAGREELQALHRRVLDNVNLAMNVLVSRDRDAAARLLAEKAAVGGAERESCGLHLQRLQAGAVESVETSNIHLETVRALRTINSLFAAVAHTTAGDRQLRADDGERTPA